MNDPQAGLIDEYGEEVIDDWCTASKQSLVDPPSTRVESEAPAQAVRVFDLPPQEALDWLVEPLVPRADLSLIVGDGGAFKSTLALHLAGSVATGSPLAGVFEVQRGPVLLVSGEDPSVRIRARMSALAEGCGWDRVQANEVFVSARAGVMLEDEVWRRWLTSEINRTEAVAVVLDPLRDLTALDLNSDRDVAKLNRLFRSLCGLPSRPAVVILHHVGKPREGRVSADRIRGSSAIFQAARSVLSVSPNSTGVKLKQLKCSDAKPLKPVQLSIEVHADRDSGGLWRKTAITCARGHPARNEAAKKAVRDYVRDHPGTSSGDLRKAARGDHSPLDISEAIRVLKAEEQIISVGDAKTKAWILNPRQMQAADE